MPAGKRKPFSWQEPWEREGDLKEWAVRGYRCCAIRHPVLGCWMLYVGVPKEHPWYGREEDAIDADVHGGVTWTGARIPLRPHAYDGGRMLWWLGVDFGHVGDLCPPIVKRHPLLRAGSTYRSLPYVMQEAERLVRAAELNRATEQSDETAKR